MGILSWLKPEPPKPQEKRAISYDLGRSVGLVDSPTRSGVIVSEQTAMGISALFCGVRVISEAVGSLPLILYERLPNGGRERASRHPLYTLLKDSPNPEMTAPVYRETCQSHALLWGASFSEIERDGLGNPIGLWPIHPSLVQVIRDDLGGLAYQIGGSAILPASDVLFIPGLTCDGSSAAYSILRSARETLGFSIAATRFGASWFGNGAKPSGYLKTAGNLSDTARQNLSNSWSKIHSGVDNAGKVGVLEEGLDWISVTGTNEQSQYVEILQFLNTQIGQLLNLSPTKLFDLGRATWANLETLQTDFVTTTLRPWLIKWEAEIVRKLISPEDRETYYPEHLVDALLRADSAARNQSYVAALTNGWMSINEVRERENMNGIGPDGDIFRVPMNTAPAAANKPEPAQVDAEQQPQPEETPEVNDA